jgi:hypothetical protein
MSHLYEGGWRYCPIVLYTKYESPYPIYATNPIDWAINEVIVGHVIHACGIRPSDMPFGYNL